MREALSNAVTATLVLCALAVAGAAARRHLFRSPFDAPGVRRVEGWRALAAEGQPLGPRGAPVTIVELSDFQCPFCAEAHDSLQRLRARHPGRIRLVYRHFPLEGHAGATAAALASECAAEQGAFEAYHDLLFRRPDSVGVARWDALARAAGVPDLGRFRDCLDSGRSRPRVDRDRRAAEALGARGTPTFVVNGWMFTGAYPPGGWERWVRNAEAERGP